MSDKQQKTSILTWLMLVLEPQMWQTVTENEIKLDTNTKIPHGTWTAVCRLLSAIFKGAMLAAIWADVVIVQ